MKKFLRKKVLPLFVLSISIVNISTAASLSFAAEISITMDDPHSYKTPLLSPADRNKKILQALDNHSNLKAALFVCGIRVNNGEGKKLIDAWNERGHLIANHSYSHQDYNSAEVTSESYLSDFLKGEEVIKSLSGFKKFFRYPFLKEGNTSEKIMTMRALMKKNGYRNGHVSIDASDWYIDQRMANRLAINPNADTTAYRDFYLKHMWERASFYNDLAIKVLGREIKHTVLIHHNLLNSLYLKDLMNMFHHKGWKLISAESAFADSVYLKEPANIPAGEGLIWALAKETGRFDDVLRYPAEDGDYEKLEMDRLGL